MSWSHRHQPCAKLPHMTHLILHFIVPLAISLGWYRQRWVVAFALMLLGLAIDVDHLLADPIYDPDRCSVGFHPLHQIIPTGIYVAMFAHERTRLIGLGLCLHILLDSIDCQLTNGIWIHTG
ncbi:MAG: DUF6122 family protein [Proteobacteria bacterium]|nr:DUF6122 family protein [Pseudomonadota bacterium]